MARAYQPGARGTYSAPEERDEPVDVPNAITAMPILLRGFRRLEPVRALEAIAKSKCLVVSQCIEPIECLTGVETPNKYVVNDMYMRPILYAHEGSDYWSRQCLKQGRDFEMLLVDNQRNVLMSSSRYGGGWNCATDCLETSHHGNSIGLLTREVFDRNFYLRIPGCSSEFVIVAPESATTSPMCRTRHTLPFPIFLQGGAKVGEIVRLNPGYLECFSDADTYMVHFPADMPSTIKLLLLQSTFLIDFTYFEDREGSSRVYTRHGYY